MLPNVLRLLNLFRLQAGLFLTAPSACLTISEEAEAVLTVHLSVQLNTKQAYALKRQLSSGKVRV